MEVWSAFVFILYWIVNETEERYRNDAIFFGDREMFIITSASNRIKNKANAVLDVQMRVNKGQENNGRQMDLKNVCAWMEIYAVERESSWYRSNMLA